MSNGLADPFLPCACSETGWWSDHLASWFCGPVAITSSAKWPYHMARSLVPRRQRAPRTRVGNKRRDHMPRDPPTDKRLGGDTSPLLRLGSTASTRRQERGNVFCLTTRPFLHLLRGLRVSIYTRRYPRPSAPRASRRSPLLLGDTRAIDASDTFIPHHRHLQVHFIYSRGRRTVLIDPTPPRVSTTRPDPTQRFPRLPDPTP